MTKELRARARRSGRWPLAFVLFGLLLGCDGFDPASLWPQSGDATVDRPAIATRDEPAASPTSGDPAAANAPRNPGMDSIGPEDSNRIYYQFVDDRGRVQFVERLTDVPAAWRDRVGYVEMNQPPPLSPLEARRSWQLSADRTAQILQASVTSPSRVGGRQSEDVLLYSATWCGYCTKARAHLDRSGVDYEIRDVDNDAVARELLEKTGRGGVPVLDFSGEILRGYRPEQYDRAIESIRG